MTMNIASTVSMKSPTGWALTRDDTEKRLREAKGDLMRFRAYTRPTAQQHERIAELEEEISSLASHRAYLESHEGFSRVVRATGEPGTPGAQIVPANGPIEAPARHTGGSEARGRALERLDAIEHRGDLTRAQLDQVSDLIERDNGMDLAARWTVLTSDDNYRAAFSKLAANPDQGHITWTSEERDAFVRVQEFARSMSLTDAAGGYLVPFQLDPTVILSNAGTSNENLRAAFTVKLATGDTWNGITSDGVVASWDPELSEVSDDSPTLASPSIPIYRGSAFVPFSIEVGQDAAGFQQMLSEAFADAKARLEAATFITGTGVGQPKGLITAAVAAGKTVATATADTFAIADLYSLKRALPARFRPNASWLGNEDVFDLARQFATGTNTAAFWAEMADGTPPRLLGKPVVESSAMDGTIDTAANNYLLVYGDLRKYVVADRIGTTVELIPHLFGTNGRPKGQRGAFMYWRTGADLIVPDAVRVLNA